MAVLMGIDYGAKRIGVAFTDKDETMAFPHGVVENSADVFRALKKLAEEKRVEKIIIGLPLDLNNEPTDATFGAREFAKTLAQELQLPVDFESEIFTTRQSARIQGTHEHIDASAAALILDFYLQKRSFMQKKRM